MRTPIAAAMLALLLTGGTAAAQPGTAEGEIRKVDRAAQKLTVRHGPIAEWDMPAMTMVFRVAEQGMLDRVAVGDKVRMAVERGGGAMTITRIEKAP